jgi:CD2 antigen cytoplasmic tail-binding protein 2
VVADHHYREEYHIPSSRMLPRQSTKRSAPAGEPSNPKKTRFLDPQDDPVTFAEEVDSQLEDPASKRKGKVKTEGYDSDSSDDGEGVVSSRKPGVEDEDEDMFAMGENEDKKAAQSRKKKDEFLRLGDIEGQEFGKLGAGDESSEDEDEPVDEDDLERREKAGMGYELSSFNMREEMEEGKFSADGMYVRSFDPHAVHDRWMEDVKETDIKRARRSARHREKVEREKIEAEEKELQELGGKTAVEKELLAKLKKGETVLEAIQRLGSKSKNNNKG